MSRKSKRNQSPEVAVAPSATPSTGGNGRRNLFIGAATALLLAFASAALFYGSEKAQAAQRLAAKNRELLASAHSPSYGSADAKVHIVEFLDPACETCAVFYGHVKKLMADNPGRIRLSVRHVPNHPGSDQVVRLLESARAQDKYWETLAAVFVAQDRWTVNHRVYAERVWPALEGVGLDIERVRRELNAADIAARMERDAADARTLGVTKTPEYFVNGRPLPHFGLQELQALVREELQLAYR